MSIKLSNVLTDQELVDNGVWKNGGIVISGPVTVDIVLFNDYFSVEENGVDLLRFYFDFRDSLIQVVLRKLVSHVRIDYEIVCSLSPVIDGKYIIKVIFPNTFGQQPARALYLSLGDVREMLEAIESCIRKQLCPFRQTIFTAFEQSQSGWLFDILRIIDHDVELSS